MTFQIIGSAEPVDWTGEEHEPLEIFYPDDAALSNPPFIHWKSEPDAHYYEIALKRENRIQKFQTKWNFYTPEKELALGDYVIQVSAYNSQNQVIGQSEREITVDKKGMNLGADFNNLKYKEQGVFLSETSRKDIISATDERQKYLKRLIEICDGFDDDFVATIHEPEEYPDGVWNYEIWNKINNESSIAQTAAVQLAYGYTLTGNKEYLTKSNAFLQKMASWNPEGSTGVYSNDHAAWYMLQGLSAGYGLLKSDLSGEDRENIRKAIELRAKDMYKFLNPFIPKMLSQGMMNDPDNNHPWFCAAGLGLGAMVIREETPEADEWASFSAQLFHGVFLPRGGSDGEWHEGLDYWSYTLFFVFQYSDALLNATGIDFYKHEWLEGTAFFKIYCHPPEGTLVPFGDNHGNPPTGFDKLIMMRLASRYNDTLAWKYIDFISEGIADSRLPLVLTWYERRKPGLYSRIFTSLGLKSERTFPFAYHFEDVGWVVSNNSVFDPEKQIIFATRSGPFIGRKFNHSHADQNHFVIAAGGDKLIWDTGYYDSYLSPHHKEYTVQSVAHNTILIDGQGQQVFTPGTDGKIREYRHKNKQLYIVANASQKEIYEGRVEKFLRTFTYNDETNFTIKDEIVLPEPGIISWLLHSEFPIEFNENDKTFLVQGERYKIEGKFVSDIAVEIESSKGFPVPPNKEEYKEPYHLEIKTGGKVEKWYPECILELKSRDGEI